MILAAGMEVEGLTEVLHRHGRALDVPSGIAATPRRVPLLEIARLRRAPEREVERVPLVRVHFDASAGLAALRRLGVQSRAVSRECRRVEVHTVGSGVRVTCRDE